jgi:YbbR domain-containing protein
MMKRLILDNLVWKALALVISVALWVSFVGSPELVTSISVPLEYQNMPSDLEMSTEGPERVYLEVRGPSARLHSFDLSRIAVILDLSSVHRPGDHTFTLEKQHIDLPYGLRLVRAVPAQVRLRFDRQLTAEVPVRLRLSSVPPHGYRLAQSLINPDRLRIVGPESRVREIQYAETDPIDLSRVVGSAQFNVHTFVRDPQVRFVSAPEVKVTVSLEKSEKNAETTVRD